MTFFSKLAAAIAALVVSLALVSCEGESKQPQKGAAEAVAGTYVSTITCKIMGQELSYDDITFTLTPKDESTIEVSFSEFGNAPMSIPSLTIPDVSVSGEAGSYEIETKEFEGTHSGKLYAGAIGGGMADGVLTIDMSIKMGSMPMALVCKFVANKSK